MHPLQAQVTHLLESEAASKDRPLKRSKQSTTTAPLDEVLAAFVSQVQHAMLPTDKDWCPHCESKHYQSACGARLDPDRTKFSQCADHGLNLCQRPACVKAWKAVLIQGAWPLASEKGCSFAAPFEALLRVLQSGSYSTLHSIIPFSSRGTYHWVFQILGFHVSV